MLAPALRKFALIFRTATRLTPAQTVGRLLHPVGAPLTPKGLDRLPEWRGLVDFTPAIGAALLRTYDAAAIAEGRFCFLAREERFGDAIDWHPSDVERLWRYHLHYLDWLVALGLAGVSYRDCLQRSLASWLDANGPGTVDAWEPYPLSLRIVNLTRLLSAEWVTSPLHERAVASVALQARALAGGIERALQGNHLIKNGKALLFAGLAFAGNEARQWERTGLAILDHQIRVQVNADGGHIERSPMYHAQVLADYLESLAALERASRPTPPAWRDALSRMLSFAEKLAHPDGDPALLADSALGLEPRAQALADFARSLVLFPVLADGDFVETGYYVDKDSVSGNYVVVDAAPIGPRLQPGHGHCQIFSYELSFNGRRVVTDSGVGSYEVGPSRTACRATAAHNTVAWKGREQSEIWAAFRVARRASIAGLRVQRNGSAGFTVDGRMHGFYPGMRRGTFRRELAWQRRGRLRVSDHWESPPEATGIVSRVHFSPELRPRAAGSRRWELVDLASSAVAMITVLDGDPHWGESVYHPTFGVSLSRPMLEIALGSDRPCVYEIERHVT